VSVPFLAAWALLCAIQFGAIAWLRHAWAFNLWAYLPAWSAAALAAATGMLCIDRVRSRVVSSASAALRGLLRAPRPAREGVGLVVLVLLLWLVRERILLGDSRILLLAAVRGEVFFPEIGGTLLPALAIELGERVSLGALASFQLLSCLVGAITLRAGVWMAAALIPRITRGDSALAVGVATLIFSGGMLRIFAGHLEVYAPLLLASIVYLGLALAFVAGRCAWFAPCLALGVALWLHAASACLVPSLALLPWLADPALDRRTGLRRLAVAAGIVAAPSLLFLAGLLIGGNAHLVAEFWQKALEILGRNPDPEALRWWVRGWNSYPSIGTDVVFLSGAHLKYLANALYLLNPLTLPVLLAFALRSPRRFVATPEARFLGLACAPTLLYATLLRPFWGPYDWDLFAITSLCMATLSAHLLVTALPHPRFTRVASGLVAFNFLFVGLPFLVLGMSIARDAGPFAMESTWKLGEPASAPPEALAPWL
jgi:hypothetical protein